ncbi:hypothetical protein Tco_1133858 [Tanacetum coccineum]
MLAPSGRGLILYQAYGNLYAMTEPGDGVTSHTRRRHNSSSDGVTSFPMASARTDLNADLEDSSYDGVTIKMRRRRVCDKATTLGEAIGDDIENPIGTEMGMPVKEAEKENEAENGIKNKPIRKARKEETTEAPISQPVEYYLGLVYEAILRKKLTRKEDIGGNLEIPCNIGGLKHMNALVDQGFDVNVMPVSTYMKLTNERPAETDIRLSLASHSYIYPLGIEDDILVEVAEHVYPVDFVILDIKEDEKRPFILGTSFLTTAKAVIKFDKGTINLTFRKSKISFHRIPESICKGEKGIKNDIKLIAPTMIVNRLVLEWDKKIKLHQGKEMEFDRWRNKNFKNKRPALVKIEDEVDDEREVT